MDGKPGNSSIRRAGARDCTTALLAMASGSSGKSIPSKGSSVPWQKFPNAVKILWKKVGPCWFTKKNVMRCEETFKYCYHVACFCFNKMYVINHKYIIYIYIQVYIRPYTYPNGFKIKVFKHCWSSASFRYQATDVTSLLVIGQGLWIDVMP